MLKDAPNGSVFINTDEDWKYVRRDSLWIKLMRVGQQHVDLVCNTKFFSHRSEPEEMCSIIVQHIRHYGKESAVGHLKEMFPLFDTALDAEKSFVRSYVALSQEGVYDLWAELVEHPDGDYLRLAEYPLPKGVKL